MMQLDNLASHVVLLPQRIATAMKDAEKTANSLQNASPTDLVNMIADTQAREFWQKNFKANIVVKEEEFKVRNCHRLLVPDNVLLV